MLNGLPAFCRSVSNKCLSERVDRKIKYYKKQLILQKTIQKQAESADLAGLPVFENKRRLLEAKYRDQTENTQQTEA